MFKQKKRSALFAPMMIVVLLIVCMITTIAYAYFSAGKSADTTIDFHGGVSLTIQAKDYPTSNSPGISITGSNKGEWLRKIDNETTWGTSTSVQHKLTMSGLRVSPQDSTGGVYVRIMVVVSVEYNGDTAPTIPNIPFVSNGTTVTINQTNCTTKEWAMVSSLNASNTVYLSGISVIALPTTDGTFTNIIDDYGILVPNATTPTNEWQNVNISAMIMITASTENSNNAWNQASDAATYSFTL